MSLVHFKKNLEKNRSDQILVRLKKQINKYAYINFNSRNKIK